MEISNVNFGRVNVRRTPEERRTDRLWDIYENNPDYYEDKLVSDELYESNMENIGVPSSETRNLLYNPYLRCEKHGYDDFDGLKRMPLDTYFSKLASERYAIARDIDDYKSYEDEGIRVFDANLKSRKSKRS